MGALDTLTQYVLQSRLVMPETWASVVLYTILYVGSGMYSSSTYDFYKKYTTGEKATWDCLLPSQINSLVVIVLAGMSLYDPNFTDRLFGVTPIAQLCGCMACGYFVWDVYVSTRHYSTFGNGALIHAVCCLLVYMNGRFVVYHQNVMLMWEISTLFLNPRIFLSATGRKSTSIYMINGLLFTLSFFVVRNVWGVYMVYIAITDMFPVFAHGYGVFGYELKDYDFAVPTLAAFNISAGTILSCLNAVWFYAIAKGAIKIATGGGSDKKEDKKE